MDQVATESVKGNGHASANGNASARPTQMKILCLGLARTSTTSLEAALTQMGYRIYTWQNMINEPRQHVPWIEASKAKFYGIGKPFVKEDWDRVLAGYDTTSDNPSIIFYRELLEAYPEALVILTVRDSPEKWFDSISTSVLAAVDEMFPTTLMGRVWMSISNLFKPPPSQLEAWDHEFSGIIRDVVPYLTGEPGVRERGIRFYKSYVAEIQALVPKERLLVFNAKQGWAPLCQFLGKEIPNSEYPRLNNTDSFRKRYIDFVGPRRQQGLRNMATSIVCLAALAGIAIYKWR